jgi:hypothetical protein
MPGGSPYIRLDTGDVRTFGQASDEGQHRLDIGHWYHGGIAPHIPVFDKSER